MHNPSISPKKLADQFKVSEPTISRDIQSLKEASTQYIRDLAKDGIAWAFTQTLDDLNSIKAEMWKLWHSQDQSIELKDKLTAIKIALQADIEVYTILKILPVSWQSNHYRIVSVIWKDEEKA